MTSLTRKLSEFAKSKRGQQVVHQAQEYARKPENQRKIAQLRERFTGQGKHSRQQ
jgi:hypothetical protein